jgi:hypothetical protein
MVLYVLVVSSSDYKLNINRFIIEYICIVYLLNMVDADIFFDKTHS